MTTTTTNTTPLKSLFVAGCGHDGRLGTGNEKNQHKFVELKKFRGKVKAVVVGGFHNFVIATPDEDDLTAIKSIITTSSNGEEASSLSTTTTNGTNTINDEVVYAFGLNEFGQLGMDSRTTFYKTPQIVPFFAHRRRKTVGTTTTVVDPCTSTDSQKWSPTNMISPACGLIDLRCGAYHTVAWLTDGLYVCGANDHGQLGMGDYEHRFKFVQITNFGTMSPAPSAASLLLKRGGYSSASAGGVTSASAIGASSRRSSSPNINNMSSGNDGGGVIPAPITIDNIHSISCGTFHTVIVAKDVVMTASYLAVGDEVGGKANPTNDAEGGKPAATITPAAPSDVSTPAATTATPLTPAEEAAQRRRDRIAALVKNATSVGMGGVTTTTTSTNPSSDYPSEEHAELSRMVDKALVAAQNEGNNSNSSSATAEALQLLNTTFSVPFILLSCGKGDFGELGYDADEWDKLSSMEKRLKQHVSNKATFVAQGGKGDDYVDFKVGGGGVKMGGVAAQNGVGFAKLKPKPVFSKPKVQRRPEFSSPTFRRISNFPFLDGFGTITMGNGGGVVAGKTSLATFLRRFGGDGSNGDSCNAAIKVVELDDDDYELDETKIPAGGVAAATTTAKGDDDQSNIITAINVKAQHHHTVVELTTTTTNIANDDVTTHQLQYVYHFGCLYCDKVETVETSIPKLACAPLAAPSPTTTTTDGTRKEEVGKSRLKFIHAAEEVLFTVVRGGGNATDIATATAPSDTTVPSVTASDAVYVIGKGNLGLGEDLDYVNSDDDEDEEGDIGVSSSAGGDNKKKKPISRRTASDAVYVIGKGNVGLGEDLDYVNSDDDDEEGDIGVSSSAGGDNKKKKPLNRRRLVFTPPTQKTTTATDGDAAVASSFTHYVVDSIVGKTHFFITLRWWSIDSDVATTAVYSFGDNFMGQCALNTDDNTIYVPTLVVVDGMMIPLHTPVIVSGKSSEPSSYVTDAIQCGFRHTVCAK